MNPVHIFKFEGRAYRLFKRLDSKDAPWYFRLERARKVTLRCMDTNQAANAEIKARAMITAAKSERWEEFLDKTALRKISTATLADLFRLYRAYPNRKPKKETRELNIHALTALVASSLPAESIPLTVINADTVWNWKQAILNSPDAQAAAPDRHRQLLRSANSRLIQARSLFTKDLQSYYQRQGKITLPKSIAEFLKEPKFASDETGRTDYWPANDVVIAKTFAALELLPNSGNAPAPHIAAQDLNLYKAIWLALGFGLRKSEISLAKNGWFQELNGILYCAGDELAKNNRFPRVRAQLGAWQKLAPYIHGQDPEAFVITGTDQERNDHLFRRCSTWMQGLGWQSQKMIHELRSYAGCQIAMGNSGDTLDLRAAQEFLRHASLTTTENFYMRYLRSILKEVKLTLPVAAPFIPKIITA